MANVRKVYLVVNETSGDSPLEVVLRRDNKVKAYVRVNENDRQLSPGKQLLVNKHGEDGAVQFYLVIEPENSDEVPFKEPDPVEVLHVNDVTQQNFSVTFIDKSKSYGSQLVFGGGGHGDDVEQAGGSVKKP